MLACLLSELPNERSFQNAAKSNALHLMEKLFEKKVNINAVNNEARLDSTSPCSLVWKSRERAHVDSSWSGPESREAGRLTTIIKQNLTRGVLPCTSRQSVVTALRFSAAHPVTRNTEIKEINISALQTVTRNGHALLVRFLLSENVDLHQKMEPKASPLHLAVLNNLVTVVNSL
ncbi:hypothetical protein CapIbe_009669 [Capra ibex]